MRPDDFRTALRGDSVLLMGILNVTPDSFSDGGRWLDPDAAVARGLQLAAEGADVIDVGGESTRPGAAAVPVDEELARVVPVVRALAAAGLAVSVDTRHARVAEASLEAGACALNDVSGLRDPAMRAAAARHGVPVVVMHSPVDDPVTMQRYTDYSPDVVTVVATFLRRQAETALTDGVPEVILDPGIGFGKTAAQNVALVRRLGDLVALGWPVLVGASRKGFIGALTGAEQPADRLGGTLAVHLACVARGGRLLRVHDVAAHRQALTMWAEVAPDPR